ncbi:MAG: hypothetical protein VB135_02495 [Burkholderia sp.]
MYIGLASSSRSICATTPQRSAMRGRTGRVSLARWLGVCPRCKGTRYASTYNGPQGHVPRYRSRQICPSLSR